MNIMKFIRAIWTVFKNVVKLAIFIGMLSLASTSFETIVVAGMAIIYIEVIYGKSLVLRQLIQTHVTMGLYLIFLVKDHNNIDIAAERDEKLKHSLNKYLNAEEITTLEETLNEGWDEFLSKNYIYYINIGFLGIIWLIAVGAIAVSLYQHLY